MYRKFSADQSSTLQLFKHEEDEEDEEEEEEEEDEEEDK